MNYLVKIKKINFWSLLSFLGLIILFSAINWNSLNMPFERDEGEYSYSAYILDRGILPYEYSNSQKPPMIIYTYWLAQKINPDAVWPPRLLAIMFTMLTIILLGVISKKEFGYRAGHIAMWISIPLLSFPYITALSANTEKFMLLPLVGILAIYTFNKSNANSTPFFFAGICAALTLLYKPIALYILVFLFIIWLRESWKISHSLMSTIKNMGMAILAILLTSFFVLLYFLLTDGGASFWNSVIVYNQHYISHLYNSVPESFLYYLNMFIHKLWILFPFLLFYFINKPKQWWLYLSLFIIAILTVMPVPTGIGHYYLILMPFWILITTSAIQSLTHIINQKKIDEWQRALTLLITSIVIIAILIPIQQQFFLTPNQLSIWIYGTGGNPFIESKIVASKIKDLTTKDDYIFVAGSEPQIYFYSNRLSSSRFVTTYGLNIDTPLRAEHQRRAIDDLNVKPPEIIIVAPHPFSGLWESGSPRLFINYLNNLLKNNYYLIGGFVWNEIGGQWKDFSNNEFNNASLLLYKKL